LFSIRSSASLTKNDILPPLSYVLIFSFYHICFFLPIMQWSFVYCYIFIFITQQHMMLDNITIFSTRKAKKSGRLTAYNPWLRYRKSIKLIQKFIAYPKGYDV
uniref:hypothetical protein n=1 Tax=Candidatus Bandiella numerosa TaxID=2570586 RepID=UPI001F239778